VGAGHVAGPKDQNSKWGEGRGHGKLPWQEMKWPDRQPCRRSERYLV
jgi:hypothetical protein